MEKPHTGSHKKNVKPDSMPFHLIFLCCCLSWGFFNWAVPGLRWHKVLYEDVTRSSQEATAIYRQTSKKRPEQANLQPRHCLKPQRWGDRDQLPVGTCSRWLCDLWALSAGDTRGICTVWSWVGVENGWGESCCNASWRALHWKWSKMGCCK